MAADKELIWVTKELAAKFNKLETIESQIEMVEKCLADRKLDISGELARLDDDVLSFKAISLKYKKSLSDAYDETQQKIEELWEKADSKKTQHTVLLKNIDIATQGLNHTLAQVDKAINGLQWKMELMAKSFDHMLSSMEKFKNLPEPLQQIFLELIKAEKGEANAKQGI